MMHTNMLKTRTDKKEMMMSALNGIMTAEEALKTLAAIKEKDPNQWEYEINKIASMMETDPETNTLKFKEESNCMFKLETAIKIIEETREERELAALLKTVQNSENKVEELQKDMPKEEIEAFDQIVKFFHKYGKEGK